MFVSEGRSGEETVADRPCRHGWRPEWCGVCSDPCSDACPGCDECAPDPGGSDDADHDTGPLIDLSQIPGGRLAWQCQLAGAVPELLSDTEVLDVVQGAEQILRWAAGLRTRMLATFADRYPSGTSAAPPGADATGVAPVDRWLPDEIAMSLSITRFDALNQINLARRLAHVLPDTLGLLEQGRICRRRAEALAEATLPLPDEKTREVEARVLPKAPDSTPRQHRDRIRRAIAHVDPDGEHRRHKEATTNRRVSIRPLEDGMASLWFYGGAEQVEPSWQMLDRLARSLGPEDPRTLEQRRFDVAMQIMQGRLTVTDQTDVDTAVTADLAARVADGHSASNSDDRGDDAEVRGSVDRATPAPDDSPGASAEPSPDSSPRTDHRSIPIATVPPDVLADAIARALAARPDPHTTVHKPLVHVVVGMDTLQGGDRPAELIGHGPIDADTARALAADAIWKRLTTDPLDGYLVEHGRKTYTPPAALADHVRARDQICRGPGCARRLRDVDHHIPFGDGHDGGTDEPNLYGLCKHCHLLKDAPGWNVIAHPDRSLTWISPHGRRTTTEPYDYRAFTDRLPDSDATARGEPAAEAGSPPVGDGDPPPF